MTTPGFFIKDWCKDREFEFAQALRGVSLVVETNIDEDTYLRAAQHFGDYAAALHRIHNWTGREIVKKFPALTLVALVGHAATDYEQNRFWAGFWDKIDIEREQGLEHDFRHAVPELLRKFKLAEFSGFEKKYVQQLAMHAGMPNYCMSDVVEAIANHLAAGREATGSALVQWLCDPGKPHRLNPLDVPARNFILHGGEFAVDIIDRVIEVVVFVADNPSSWMELANAGELTTATTGLPGVMLDGLLEILEKRDVDELSKRVRPAAGSNIGIPFISLDTVEDTVRVILPGVGTGAASWTVSLDGESTDVRGSTGWGSTEQAPAILPIGKPTRVVVARQDSADRSFTLPLIDPADPLVLFASDGRMIARRNPVPRGEVYALLPKGRTLVDGASDIGIEPDIDLGIPSGWRDWRLVTVSTEARRSIQLVDSGTRVGTARAVRNSHVPELILEDALLGVTSTSGAPVYAERPWVWLPTHPSGATIHWRVGVRRVGEVAWIARTVWELSGDDLTVDPFGEAQIALLGAYEIVVRGPLGSDLRRIVFLAEGLALATAPECRWADVDGLTKATVEVSCVSPLTSSIAMLTFERSVRQKVLPLGSGQFVEQLVVCPPWIEVRLDPRGERPTWTPISQTSTPEAFGGDNVLAIRVPTAEPEVLIRVRDANNRYWQDEVPSYRPHSDSFEVSTLRFRDTVNRLGAAQLVAEIDNPGQPRLTLPIAVVRPKELCDTMYLIGDRIEFRGLAALAGITAQIWSEAAPWRAAAVVAVADAAVALPLDLQSAGPVLVRLVVDDPWSPVSVPRWPTSDAVRLDQKGWVTDPNAALSALSQYLAGGAQLPAYCGACPEVWTALAATVERTSDWRAATKSRGLAQLLVAEPRSSLELLPASGIPVERHAELVVASGIVLQQFSSFGVSEERSVSPWVACMTALADLPSLGAADQDGRVDVVTSMRRDGGTQLVDIVTSGRDAGLANALFDGGTLAMDGMQTLQVDEIFAASGIVPGALLDTDTRVTAVAEAFRVRTDWAASSKCGELNSIAAQRLKIIRRASRVFYDQVSIRSEALHGLDSGANPWLLMPTASLTIAFLARLEAHELTRVKSFDGELTRAWAAFARICPKLVLSDLLTAEAMITHFKNGNILGENDV